MPWPPFHFRLSDPYVFIPILVVLLCGRLGFVRGHVWDLLKNGLGSVRTLGGLSEDCNEMEGVVNTDEELGEDRKSVV